MTDNRAVLLLDMRTVIRLPGAAAGEGNPMPLTPRQQMAVDELAAIVAVKADQWYRQPLPHAMHCAAHALLILAPHRVQLDPGRRDVDGAERTQIEPLGAAATVRDQIDFQEAGAGVVPVRERAHGYLLAQQMARVGDRRPPQRVLRSGWLQHACERCPTDLPQEFLDVGRDRELAPDPQTVQQLGNKGLQPMGPDPATGLPQHFRRRGDLTSVSARSPTGPRRG